MSTNMFNRSILVLFAMALGVLAAAPVAAQDVVPAPEARPSPMAVAQATFSDGTYVVVRYGSPRMRGRDVFGELVPYGEVWRLGANEATEITATQDIMFGDTRLPAGTYTLFAIPNEDEWTLILNENLGQWGAFSYDEEADFAQLNVDAQQSDQSHEAFTITLEPNDEQTSAQLSMVWDQTRVMLPINPIE